MRVLEVKGYGDVGFLIGMAFFCFCFFASIAFFFNSFLNFF